MEEFIQRLAVACMMACAGLLVVYVALLLQGACQDRGAYARCVAAGSALCVKLDTKLPECQS